MNNINEEYIEEYIKSILPDKPEFFMELECYADKNHVPIIHPEVAQFLILLLKMKKPLNILEVGTAIGYSSLIMAYGTQGKANITTIEKRQDMIDIAIKNINNSSYSDKIEILEGEAEEILPNLIDKYDFIFLDASKGHYLDFFENCSKLLNDEGLIVSDNVLYKGMVASDELVVRRKKTIVKRMRQYLKHISDLEGFITSVLPLGDGVAITYKEGGI
ncbi:O-methyltransferase [Sporanaerobacter acetigenes]|uniref:tRNA 5-hydroxyuridine methyltransferase n=1 Tax=Sporanaerobacter acetigenes DSM 13106 TaxID=1123281 RepID=A0A1M5UBS6_9FIRM|nr:O-methyltransferase [Sporanaerobacter acetigenes]SHH60472.1 Predicted O-methyltransferase YrrM [Sporanaerobacter acetigenes DSM 13106]